MFTFEMNTYKISISSTILNHDCTRTSIRLHANKITIVVKCFWGKSWNLHCSVLIYLFLPFFYLECTLDHFEGFVFLTLPTTVRGTLTICCFCTLRLAPCVPTMAIGCWGPAQCADNTRPPLHQQTQLLLCNASVEGGREAAHVRQAWIKDEHRHHSVFQKTARKANGAFMHTQTHQMDGLGSQASSSYYSNWRFWHVLALELHKTCLYQYIWYKSTCFLICTRGAFNQHTNTHTLGLQAHVRSNTTQTWPRDQGCPASLPLCTLGLLCSSPCENSTLALLCRPL